MFAFVSIVPNTSTGNVESSAKNVESSANIADGVEPLVEGPRAKEPVAKEPVAKELFGAHCDDTFSKPGSIALIELATLRILKILGSLEQVSSTAYHLFHPPPCTSHTPPESYILS